ncbi:MAG: hypothetical protein RLZZ584_960, partial [Pseudomonadota bacterium]
SGPNVFAGYRVASHNAGLWIDRGDGRQWLNTGDLGRQDAEGYFYLTGRKKELIIRGGHNIDPAAIEQPLQCHPSVLMAAAVGRPDVHSGEIPVAYVQLKPAAQATEEELLAFARDRIGERAAVPKLIRIVSAMPLTGVGKIFKPDLRLREAEDALGHALRSAGIRAASIKASIDPSRGTVVDVTVVDRASHEAAAAVLGQFPLQCRLTDLPS